MTQLSNLLNDLWPATTRGRRKMRAISQDNSASIQKLNEELRNLKAGTELEESNKNRPKRSDGNTRKPKS